MQRYITYETEDGKVGLVTKIIENPTDEQLEVNGFYADNIPQPDTANGMVAQLMVRLPYNELYHDYTLAAPATHERIAALQDADLDNKEAIALLLDMANARTLDG